MDMQVDMQTQMSIPKNPCVEGASADQEGKQEDFEAFGLGVAKIMACPICLSCYNDQGDRIPKALSCQHTYGWKSHIDAAKIGLYSNGTDLRVQALP